MGRQNGMGVLVTREISRSVYELELERDLIACEAV